MSQAARMTRGSQREDAWLNQPEINADAHSTASPHKSDRQSNFDTKLADSRPFTYC